MEEFAQNNDLIEKLSGISLLLMQKDDIAVDEGVNENDDDAKVVVE